MRPPLVKSSHGTLAELTTVTPNDHRRILLRNIISRIALSIWYASLPYLSRQAVATASHLMTFGGNFKQGNKRMTRHMKARQAAKPKAKVPSLTTIAIQRPPALAKIVAERIRDAIIFGTLGLGESVSEERLASTLGVSRTPVREALTLLQLQGLVDIIPQRGSFVFKPTQADIEELCEFRAMVETGALRLALVKNQAETIRDLQAAQDALEQAEQKNDWVTAARADADFHAALFKYCGNRPLVNAYDLIAGRIGAARFFARRSGTSKRKTGDEHTAIIEAMKRNKAEAAVTLLTEHIFAMPVRFAEIAATEQS